LELIVIFFRFSEEIEGEGVSFLETSVWSEK